MQELRIIPLGWTNRISMHLEIHGCNYEAEHDLGLFNGNDVAEVENPFGAGSSLGFSVSLQFTTTKETGLILYGAGGGVNSNSHVGLSLQESKLVFVLNTPTSYVSLTSAASLLDDNLAHSASLEYADPLLKLTVDGLEAEVKAPNMSLHFVEVVYVGGHLSPQNESFEGCLGQVAFNGKYVKEKKKKQDGAMKPRRRKCFQKDYSTTAGNGRRGVGGSLRKSTQISFPDSASYIRIRQRGQPSSGVRIAPGKSNGISLQFRTFEADGLLLHHGFRSNGFVRILLEDARPKAVVMVGRERLDLDAYDLAYNDGKWHTVSLVLSGSYVNFTVDDEAIIRRLDASPPLKFSLGYEFLLGGGLSSIDGFVGCTRDVILFGKPLSMAVNDERNTKVVGDVSFGRCYSMRDRCSPNPCQHEGICNQTSREFFCDCEATGYTGATCQTSTSYRSCADFSRFNPNTRFGETWIDLDGSGPLAPFPVRCEFLPDGRNITYVGHMNEEAAKVDGFDGAGSFMQTIFYNASFEAMDALKAGSKRCVQKLGYDCKSSRLLNTPVKGEDDFKPFGYWRSRDNELMDYWAGSTPGSFQCECGLLGACFDPQKGCNCDSGHDDWLWDGGEITYKEHLPVRSLHFGDTGTAFDGKEGRYSLGPLECQAEDAKIEDSVTLTKSEAALEVAYSLDNPANWDLYFEFKTAIESNNEGKIKLVETVLPMSGDFFRVSMINASSGLEFSFGLGGLDRKKSVTIRTGSKLNDNNWHSVEVVWNIKETVLILDKNNTARLVAFENERPLAFDGEGRSIALRFGGDGFRGCVKSAWLSGAKLALRLTDLEAKNGVVQGCRGKCDNLPCLNGGRCIEGYNEFQCDCDLTPYKGRVCEAEVASRFDGDLLVRANLPAAREIFNLTWTNDARDRKKTSVLKIGLGFSLDTKEMASSSAGMFILGLFTEKQKDHLVLFLSSNGRLSLHLRSAVGGNGNNGRSEYEHEEQTFSYKGEKVNRGRYYYVKLRSFDMGRQIMMQIDNLEPERFVIPDRGGHVGLEWKHLYMGGLPSTSASIKAASNKSLANELAYFAGCMSSVEINSISPLKLNTRILEIMSASGKGNREMVEATCASAFPPQKLPRDAEKSEDDDERGDVTTTKDGLFGKSARSKESSSEAAQEEDDADSNSYIKYVFVLSVATVLLLAYLIGKYVKRHTGVYLTREDEGAEEATDADTAVLHSKTGHQVEKKQEWFI